MCVCERVCVCVYYAAHTRRHTHAGNPPHTHTTEKTNILLENE